MDNAVFHLSIMFLMLTMLATSAGGEQVGKTPEQRLAEFAGQPPETDGVGPAARFFAPEGIKTDGTFLYITDTNNNTIRRMTIADRRVTTIAGCNACWGGEDGIGGGARFSLPRALTMDEKAIYVADTNNDTIRRIEIATGAVTTLAGSPGQPETADGVGPAARFSNPEGIATDGTSLFVADSFNHTIRRVVIATGAVTTLAGSPGLSGAADGAGNQARFCVPRGLVTDGTTLFVADSLNHSIRRVEIATGTVTTIAGSAAEWGAVDGVGSGARFFTPNGLALDGKNLFVTDTGNQTIRMIEIVSGKVTTLAGKPGNPGYADCSGANARFFAPHGITTDGTCLYVADTGSDTIRRIEIATGSVTTMAGAPRRVRFIRMPPSLGQ